MSSEREAIEFALAWWRRCRRPDLSDEDKVRGAIMRYREFIDAAALLSPILQTAPGRVRGEQRPDGTYPVELDEA